MEHRKKTTIYDIAAELNISSGTVYRALHNKGRIREETRKKVLETAEKLNYSINQTAQALRRNPLSVGVVLCCPVPPFLDEIRKGIEAGFAEIEEYNVFPDVRVMPRCNAEQCPDAVLDALRDFETNGCFAVILFLSGSTEPFAQQLNAMGKKGVKIVTIVNDISCENRIFHVTADGFSAGAMAAEFLGLCCPDGKIAILTGNKSTYIHEKNINGFLSYAEEGNFSAMDVYEHNDDPDLVHRSLKKIFEGEKKYDGVYVSTASTISAFLYLKKLDPFLSPKIVTTDLFRENVKLMEMKIARATIFQAPFKQGKEAVKKLYRHITGEFVPESVKIAPYLVLRSNMDAFIHEDDLR